MSGRVWRHRQLGRGDYEIESTERDGTGRRVEAFVSFPSHAERPSLTIRKMVDAYAAVTGGVVDGAPGVDWERLGWSDGAEHEAMLADVHRIIEGWRGLPHEQRLLGYINSAKAVSGIPERPPYTVDQLDDLDRLVRRAPQVIAQDLAAEGTAA